MADIQDASTEVVKGLQDSDDDEDDEEKETDDKVLELDLDDEEDDDEILKALMAKKASAASANSAIPIVTVEGEKTVTEEGEEEHSDVEDAEESDDDLSEEEEMTEEERRIQRKMAKKFIKSQKQKTNAGGFFEDEAEMSEDGGHTDDDAGDDMADDLDELVEGIDFVNEKEDERRAARRIAAHMKHEQEQDERELEKIKEQVANGFKRKGDYDGPDSWQRRKRGENGEESESDDMDYGPVIERPEELVEMSDDDEDALAWREQAARRRRLQEQGTQETLTQLPSAFEGVSQEISAAVLGRKNSNSISMFDSQNTRDGVDDDIEFGRSNSMPILHRTSSQLGAGSSMLDRQTSMTFIGRQRQVTKSNNGPILGDSGASRSYVFARTDSQGQWGGDDSAPTKFNELGRDDNARSNFGNARSTAKDAPKKKQSLFSMIQAPAADASKSSKLDVQKAIKEALGQKN